MKYKDRLNLVIIQRHWKLIDLIWDLILAIILCSSRRSLLLDIKAIDGFVLPLTPIFLKILVSCFMFLFAGFSPLALKLHTRFTHISSIIIASTTLILLNIEIYNQHPEFRTLYIHIACFSISFMKTTSICKLSVVIIKHLFIRNVSKYLRIWWARCAVLRAKALTGWGKWLESDQHGFFITRLWKLH